ncbi:MAG: RNA 2',3'-cyclic phosphodiesterase [Methanomicrobiales archaeon]|nr:RNA 2',3'-cyclic phosphodiesterase [Methanomicrobiales archaeon]
MVRTFLALDLSEDIRRRIEESQGILRRSSARLTFVDPAAAHMTIKFLGEVPEELLPKIITAIRGVRCAPFDISITGIGCNSRVKPRVIWGVVKDHGESAALAHQVDEILAPLGFPKENRPFRPHITLARVRECDDTLVRQVLEIAETTLGSVRVSCLKLKKSTLTTKGPIYEDLAEAALG